MAKKKKQKKAAKRKAKQKEKQRYRERFRKDSETLENFRTNAPQMKEELRKRGCDLPFYDYLDSYSDEFRRTAQEAKRRYRTLMDVREVSEDVYKEGDWASVGYGHLEQILFSTDDAASDYGDKGTSGDIRGCTVAFHDPQHKLHTLVLIPRSVKLGNLAHPEFKYVAKIASLCHEVGHVHDIEAGVNFDVTTKRADIIEAEVFANLYALNLMAERQLVQSYTLLITGLQDAATKGGYLGVVGQRVLDQLPEHKLIVWNDYLDAEE